MRLFICTDKADEARLETLTDVLDGYRMTIDIDRIIGERDSRPSLQASIQDCEAFVFALTPNTVNNRRCHWEFAQAVHNERPIIVAMLETVEPLPRRLEEFLVIDMDHPNGAEQLLDALYVAGATPPSILVQLFRNRILLAIVMLMGFIIAYLLAGPYSPFRDTITNTLIGVVQVADRADTVYNPPDPTADPTLVALQVPLQQMTLSANADAIFQRGQELARNGDYAAAIDTFNRTLAISPGSVGAHIARGNAFLAIGNPDTAWGDFTRAIELAPGLPLPYISRAAFYIEVGEAQGALNDANAALSRAPNNPQALIVRGRAYTLLGNTDDAITDFTRALQLDPQQPAALTYRGVAYQIMGNNKQALADYDAALILNPVYAPAYTERGLLHRANGEDNRAAADFTRAIELSPNDPRARAARAGLMTEAGEYDRAITDFTRALRIQPSNATLYRERARAYRCANNPTLAVADLTRAAELELDATAAYISRPVAYRCVGSPSLQIDSMRVGSTDPDLNGAYVFIAGALRGRAAQHETNGNLNSALADLSTAIRLTPAYTEVAALYHLRGSVNLRSGNVAAAQADYEAAIDIVPERGAYHLDYGRALAAAGDTEAALLSYNQAIALAPLLIEAQLAKGDLYYAEENREAALDAYTRAGYIDRDYPPTLTRRARVLAELGRCNTAEADIGLLQAVAPDDAETQAVQNLVSGLCGTQEANS